MLFSLTDDYDVLPGYVSVAHNPAGDLVAAVISGRETISLLDAKSGEMVVNLSGLNSSGGPFVFTPDGGSLLIGEGDSLKTLALDTGDRRLIRSTHFLGGPTTLQFSPDHATLFATGLQKSNGNTAYVLDAKTLAPVATLTPPDRQIYLDGMYTPDGKVIITGNSQNIDLWDAQTFSLKTTVQACKNGQASFVWSSLSLSKDGTTLTFTCRRDVQYLRFMDIQTGKAQDVPIDEATGTTDALYSPDGEIVAVTAYSGRIYLIDAKTHQSRAILSTGTEEPTSIAFNPDGSLLAVGTANGTVQLWNVAARTKRILFSFRYLGIVWADCPSYGGTDAECRSGGHSINAIAFNAAGTLIATTSRDGIVRLFGIAAS